MSPSRLPVRALLALTTLIVAAGCHEVPELPIGAVQGMGERSPYEGRDVVVEGVVTAVFPGLEGFFLQSAPGEEDGDPATSDALFVVVDAAPEGVTLSGSGAGPLAEAAPGDRLRIRGRVTERGDAPRTLTSLVPGEVLEFRPGTGLLPDPVPVTATPGSPDAWGRLEGMRVRVEAPLTVTGTFGLQRFGEAVVSFEGRLYQPTELHPPGPDAEALAARNEAARLVLDDGSNEQWPHALSWLGGWPTSEAPFRAGTRLGPVTGIVDVRRGGFLLLPVEEVPVLEEAARPPPPALPDPGPGAGVTPGSVLRVGVLNVENLFNGDGRGGGFPTPRGAQTPELYQLQQAKLVATLQSIEVDVVALAEVENDGVGPTTALRQFVEALNAAGPVRDWRAIEIEGPGTDAIRTALIYRTGRVAPVGAPVVPDHPIFAWGSRPPLGHAFVRIDGSGTPVGEPWLVLSNHLKSKGGCPETDHPHAAPGDFDLGDGQACWNAHRVTAAEAMADWLDRDPAGLGEEFRDNALIVGDLNSYGAEDPIRLLEGRGWADAFALAGHERPYSYIFQGQSGRLDHVLVPRSRAHLLTGAAIWHSNADEWTGFGYEYDPEPHLWRSSDHDVLLVGVGTGIIPD
jgi:uncharacterized protein